MPYCSTAFALAYGTHTVVLANLNQKHVFNLQAYTGQCSVWHTVWVVALSLPLCLVGSTKRDVDSK